MGLYRSANSIFLTSLACLVEWSKASSFTRFHAWFPNSAQEFAHISEKTCNATLSAWETAYEKQNNTDWIDIGIHVERPIFQLCRDHMSCILENTSEATKATLSTSGVVLGLLPTLLAVLSPSLSELALLSAQRPLMALLLSVGAPGVLQTRIFEYEDPSELVDPPEGSKQNVRAQLVLGPWSRTGSVFFAIIQYILTLGCGVNTVSLALQIRNRSILSWGCTRTWPLILWVFVPILIHGLAAIGYRMTLENRRPYKAIALQQIDRTRSFFGQPAASDNAPKGLATSGALSITEPTYRDAERHSILGSIGQWLIRECNSCAYHSPALKLRLPRTGLSTKVHIGVLLTCIGGFLSFFHLLYGTVTFSGLLFIDTLDAIGYVMMRFLASSIICRFIVLVEIAGMRGAMWRASQTN